MRKSIIGFLLVPFWVMAQPVQKTMKRLPDTGEINSYTTTFGEDHDYLVNPPGFTVNGNGTVTDTTTGLVWQRVDGGEMTIENALVFADTATIGGFTDWRLPTAGESFSILNHQKANPALETSVFPSTSAEYWWTSDRQANDPNKIWCTNAGGGIGNHPKTETISAGGTKRFHVRLVRNPNPVEPIAERWTNHGDGTLTDGLTELTWTKVPIAGNYTWEEALTQAENLERAGKTDWRLPNIKELRSLNDETKINPSVSSLFFIATAEKYWSSTTLPNQTGKAWYWHTQFGITTYDVKTVANKVLAVRGPDLVAEMNPNLQQLTTPIVYPNPFLAGLTIQTGLVQPCKVYVCDFLGKEKLSIQVYGNTTLDLGLLSHGIYFLKFPEMNKTLKVFKE
jgi:hypothetical protein